MNLAEYAKALTKLPVSYKMLPYEKKIECMYHGTLAMTNGDELIRYIDGEWHPVTFEEVMSIA